MAARRIMAIKADTSPEAGLSRFTSKLSSHPLFLAIRAGSPALYRYVQSTGYANGEWRDESRSIDGVLLRRSKL
jgi:hypothetical protein